MASNSKQKLKLLYIMKILLENSDEKNSMTVNQIIKALSLYDISAERKSVYTDIELLVTFGMDIICDKGRSNKYFIGKRDFQLPELKLLVDAVQSSKFITSKKSEDLIRKLEKLTSRHEASDLHRHVIVTDRIKTINESIYYNIDAIHEGIQQNRKIQFKYFDYSLDKSLMLRRNGEVYCVCPYALTWFNENYYLIAYHDRYKSMSHFRVDRMIEIVVSEHMRDDHECFQNFNVVEYSKNIFKMFGGESQKVELEFDNSLVNVVIDRFGREVVIYDKQDDRFRISVDVAITNAFFSWVFMQGRKVKIIGPEVVIDEYKGLLSEIERVY